jgi:ATP-dependent Clp protease ATP-binding subunit ClpA
MLKSSPAGRAFLSHGCSKAKGELLRLDQILHERVIGLDGCDGVADVVRANRLKDPKRPIGSLFCGPTGVGKTELARALAGRSSTARTT